MYKSTNTTWSTTFPLDKSRKKDYTESTQMKLNMAAFDKDEVAGSAVDYLYDKKNQSKTQSFLKNNGFPSAQEREFGKELLGVQEERKNLLNEFKNKVKAAVPMERYDESDRGFLKGLLGDEEGEREYQKRVANVNAQNAANTRKQNELLNAFKGSQFESLLKPSTSYIAYEERFKNVQDSVRSAPEQGEYLSVLQPTLAYNVSKQPENKQFSSGIKNSDYSDKGLWYVEGTNGSANAKTSGGSRATKTADKIIQDNAIHIKNAAKEFGVDPGILAAAIYTEQALNVSWKDNIIDPMVAGALDVSLGVGQIRISTAKLVEDVGYIEKTKNYEWHTNNVVNNRREGIISKLQNPKENIRYAAAYLSYIQDLWKSSYPGIDKSVAILATVYNLGTKQTTPNAHPKANEFGNFADANYIYICNLLGLD